MHQLVIKRFQHCLMHGVTMKFILHVVGVTREVFDIRECAEWNNSERLYYDGTRRTFLGFEEIE